MRGLIRWVLKHIPRSLMQRCASLAIPIIGLLYLGRGKECPICGTRRRGFLPYGYNISRPNALCPGCLSLERHRLLWLFLQRETNLMTDRPKLLHIAPEVCFMRRLRKLYRGKEYITADLESPLADIHFDIQSIPLNDNFTDVIMCNHILEHIPDEGAALDELYRILRPNGWAILLVPNDQSRATTFEDSSITDPEERNRIFGQYDHYRIYGRDFADRVRSHGFEVEEINYNSTFTPEQQAYYSLDNEIIFKATKRK